jgi:hypothetical protein
MVEKGVPFTRSAIVGLLGFVGLAKAQILPLPVRPPDAPSATAFIAQITPLAQARREEAIFAQIVAGNVPDFLRRLCPITLTNVVAGQTNFAMVFVTPDYLAVGTDEDYLLTPLTPATAQRIADQLSCSLPTPKLVNDIYGAAQVRLAPTPLTPGPGMITVPAFTEHNRRVRQQRSAALTMHPFGALVAGHKKDIVISARLATAADKVAIYGWHQTSGTPIQPLYLGHADAWVDYSHGTRLVQQKLVVNGTTRTVAEVLADPQLASLLSDEGRVTRPRYPTNTAPTEAAATNPFPLPETNARVELHSTGHFGERSATFTHFPEVRIQLNAPAAAEFAITKPVLLILYALPNGNSIEQTIGRTLKPGDDWHFDIQHIGAQTRFLRELCSHRTVVIAYLEAAQKSWPAWRKKHGDEVLPKIVERVKKLFPAQPVEVVLTGHSGGGSFTLGYLNAVTHIPNDVVRLAFLDSNYAYTTTNHLAKLTRWLQATATHHLCVLAYDDASALLEGKSFVSAEGGTWGRSHAMLRDLSGSFLFTHQTHAGLETSQALAGRVQFLLQENPGRKILHTIQVERNGFIHALLTGTPLEGRGYEYFGPRAYTQWILSE